MTAPLCIDCKWHGIDWELGTACTRPLSDAVSPVDGEYLHTASAYLHNERRPGKTFFGRTRCGPEGKFFEPRPPAIRPVCKECGR